MKRRTKEDITVVLILVGMIALISMFIVGSTVLTCKMSGERTVVVGGNTMVCP